MKDFKEVPIVSSIARGAAVSLAWSSEINTAMSKFYQDKNADNLASALVAAHDKYGKCAMDGVRRSDPIPELFLI